MKTLAEMFERSLHDIYYAENAITKGVLEARRDLGDANIAVVGTIMVFLDACEPKLADRFQAAEAHSTIFQ